MKIEKITHYNAQAAEHVRRGFAHAKVDEWCDAKGEFEAAAEICPDCGMYRFYIIYAETDGLTVPFRLYVDTGFDEDATMAINREYKAIFKALNDEERAIISEEFGIDLTNETTLKASLVPYFLSDIGESNSAGFDMNIQFLDRILTELEGKKAFETKVAKIVYDWCENSGYFNKDLYDWSYARIPDSDKPQENTLVKGVYTVIRADLLPITNGVLKFEDRRIEQIKFKTSDVAKAASKLVKKFVITPNIKRMDVCGFNCPIVEVEEKCNITTATEIAAAAAEDVIQIPKGSTVKAYSFKGAFYCADGAFYNEATYNYSSGRVGYMGAVMGRAMYLPLKKATYEKKFSTEDFDVNKFKNKVTSFFGKPNMKGRKFIKLAPEKQYAKARKMNKEK